MIDWEYCDYSEEDYLSEDIYVEFNYWVNE